MWEENTLHLCHIVQLKTFVRKYLLQHTHIWRNTMLTTTITRDHIKKHYFYCYDDIHRLPWSLFGSKFDCSRMSFKPLKMLREYRNQDGQKDLTIQPKQSNSYTSSAEANSSAILIIFSTPLSVYMRTSNASCRINTWTISSVYNNLKWDYVLVRNCFHIHKKEYEHLPVKL